MALQKFSNNFSSLVRQVQMNPLPVYPQFSSFSSRLNTFKSFPVNTSQNKYSLSESGFKYTGADDIVECFCCGLILHNWEGDDIPWIEHTRLNPKCMYVLLSKGNQFIENVLSKYCKTEHIYNCEELYDAVC